MFGIRRFSIGWGPAALILLIASISSGSELCNVISGIDVTPLPVQPDYSGSQLSADFTMDAEFDSTAPFQCGCCEYRQYIRGSVGSLPFTEDGNPIDYRVVDPANPANRINLSNDPQNRVEDYPDYGGSLVRYGHRTEAQSADESYTNGGTGPNAGNVNRLSGCHYHGHDKPGINNLQSGHAYAVNLVFRGEIVCAQAGCGAGGPPHRQKEWIISLQKTQP